MHARPTYKKANALDELGDRSEIVVSALVALLDDEKSGVRYFGAEALGKLGKKSSDVVAAVVRWIERHQDSEALGNVIDAIWDAVVEE